MTKIRTTPLSWYPPAANGITLTSVTTPAWGNSASWTEVVASTAADIQLMSIALNANNTSDECEHEIGVGAAGVEVAIATRRSWVRSAVGDDHVTHPLRVPIDAIPSGSRVAVRMRDSNAASGSVLFALGYTTALDADQTTSTLLTLPSAANGVSLTPNASAWVNSAYGELSSALPTRGQIASLVFDAPVTGVWVEADLATGAAGVETVVSTLKGFWNLTNINFGMWLPAPYDVAASTRVAVRMRKEETSTSAWRFAAEYYTDPIIVPVVETLAATGVRSVQARLNGRIDPNTIAMMGRFAWGTDPDDLSNETTPEDVGDGDGWVNYHVLLSGLEPETTYYFRAIGNDGSSDLLGEILSFTTLGEQTFVDGRVAWPLTWHEQTLRDESMVPFAEVDLNDPITYYGGYKAPWVDAFLSISRGLSSHRDGLIRHLEFGAVFTDTHKYFRELLEDEVNRFLTNRPALQRFIDDEERRVQGLPALAAVGYVQNYALVENLKFELNCSDWLRKKYSRKRNAQQAWQPLISADDFPNCPKETVGLPAPLVYGSLGLAGADPVENVTITVNAQPTAAPSSFSLSLQSGGRLAGVRRYYKVGQVVGGIESEQTPTLTSVTTDANKTIRLNFTPDGSATSVIVYSSHRPDFGQFCYTVLPGSATQYDDDTTPPNQDANWLLNTDWTLGLRLNLTFYVYAKLAGGLYSRPGIATKVISPLHRTFALQERDVDIDWDPHAGEVDGYLVIRKRSYYSGWNEVFDRQEDVGTGVVTFNDDLVTTNTVTLPEGELVAAAAAGQLQAIPIGQTTLCGQTVNGLLVARHACARVGNIYLPKTIENVDGESETTYEPIAESDFGVTWFAPDHAGWTELEKFIDIGGRAYTLIGTTVDPLPEKVLVDVDGIETDGDGLGEVILSIVDQRLHFATNWLAPDDPYQSGPYLTAADTTFPHVAGLPLVDAESHQVVKDALRARLGGTMDYEGATIIGANGEFVTGTEALARFQVSGDFEQVFNLKGQDAVACEPIEAADPADLAEITEVRSIRDGSFRVNDDVLSGFFNLHPYVHTRDYTGRESTGWYGRGEERHLDSIENYDQEREAPLAELHCLRSNTTAGAATIADVMKRRKARYAEPRRSGTLEMSFEGLALEPGMLVRMTHTEATGAAGWADRQVRLTDQEIRPTEGVVRFDFYDMEPVFANQEVAT